MKVMECIDGLHPGGKERRLVELLKSLAGGPRRIRGADVRVEAELVVMSEENRYPEVLTLGIPIWPMMRKTTHDMSIFGRLYRLVKQRRPDVIHTWDPMTSFYAAPVAALLGIPLVNGMITKAPAGLSWLSPERLVGMLTFPLSRIVVGNSQAGLRSYHAPEGKSRCIHNGFNMDRLHDLDDPAFTRKQWGIETPRVVAMVGGFTPKKDYVTYLAAAERILRMRRDVTFLAIGDGETLDNMKAAVAPAHRDRILFTGWLERVESLMLASDVGVLATDEEVHGEGIPNAALEFMALGKPVVATRTGGTEELVLDGKTGFLIPNRDTAALVARLTEILGNPDLARQLGSCGKSRVESDFNIDAMTSAFLNLYSEVS